MRKYLAILLMGIPLVTNAQPVVVVRVQQPAELGFSAPWQDTTVTAGDPLILGTDLSVFGGSGEYSYRWTPGAGLSDSTIAQPIATPFDTTTYVLTVTDENGCSFGADYKVRVVLPLVNIGLVSGWNIFSSRVMPANPDMQTISQELITDGALVKIQDEIGNTLEDIGTFGAWVNSIGELNLAEGYKVKVTSNCQLNLTGVPVRFPYRIPLVQGWNIIGYPRSSDADALGVVQQLIDRGTLVKVQDEKGNSLEDFGSYGSWINNVGNFTPGKGYKIRVADADTLTIFESYPKSAAPVRDNPFPASHFTPLEAGNGVDHMNLNLVGLPEGFLEEGDEVAVFDGSLCLGAVRLMPWHVARRSVSIPVSARDGEDTPGFTVGNRFSLKAWRSATEEEFPLEPEIIKGGDTFRKQESTFLSLAKYSTTGTDDINILSGMEIKLYPNPNGGKFTIHVSGKTKGVIKLRIIDHSGRILMEKSGIDFRGEYTESVDVKLPAGVYSLLIETENHNLFKHFIIK
jgi:hypothetical protein